MVGSVGALFGDIDVDEVEAATNSWISVGAGNWHSASDWSLSRIPTNGDSCFLTNAITKAIFVTSATTGTTSMVISNLTISAPSGTQNAVQLTTSGTNVPLRILNLLKLGAGSALEISNGMVQVEDLAGPASFSIEIDGTVLLRSPTARLICTNGQWMAVGSSSSGQLTISNGTMLATTVFVSRGGQSSGTMTVAGGTNTLTSVLRIGESVGSTGTVWLTGGQLSVPNAAISVGYLGNGRLTLSNGTLKSNLMLVPNFGTARGALNVAGGTYSMSSALIIGYRPLATGEVWVTGGQLAFSNNITSYVGNEGVGRMVISNGTVNAGTLVIAGEPGSAGTLTVAGGTFTADRLVATNYTAARIRFPAGIMTLRGAEVDYNEAFEVGGVGGTAVLNVVAGTNLFRSVSLGSTANSTGTMWVTGGELVTTNFGTTIADFGTGTLTLSNGTWRANNIYVGSDAGSRGTLRIASGTCTVSSSLIVAGSHNNATGLVWVTGGLLGATSITGIGVAGNGEMTVSNGTYRSGVTYVGYAVGSRGTLTVAGGVSSVYFNLTLGQFGCGATGIVNVTGGALRVTNTTVNAVLDVRSGTLTHSGGTLDIDRLIITNACGRFIHTGGTLITGFVTLTPEFDADGDGLPNEYEQNRGLDPLAPNNGDTDGDGQTDLEEYAAGTDPTDNASAFRITSVIRTNNNIRIVWTTVGGKTNRVLVATPVPGGSFTNEFSNLSPLFFIPGSGDSITNFTDIGGATNVPSRYYRVRVIP